MHVGNNALNFYKRIRKLDEITAPPDACSHVRSFIVSAISFSKSGFRKVHQQ